MLFLQPPAVNLSYFIRFNNEDVFFLCAFTLKTVDSTFFFFLHFKLKVLVNVVEQSRREVWISTIIRT